MRHTATVYYWGIEASADILSDIHDHERIGWHVHQIVPRANTKILGGVTVTEHTLFVVYAKDEQ